MYVIGVACIINIALDFLFIGHMGLGPVGAALGTVTAQTASVASHSCAQEPPHEHPR